MKMSNERIQPIKCALRYNPPILGLIYKDNDTGKTRKRSMPLRGFSAETDVELYAKKLVATPRHEMYVRTIPLSQLHSLLQRVKDAHQDEERGGPSQTTTPIHQSSLRDIPPLSPLTTPLGKLNQNKENRKFEDDITKLLGLDDDDDVSAELDLDEKKHETLASAVTTHGFGGSPPLQTSTPDDNDDIEDDPLLKVLQGKTHSPIRETFADLNATHDKVNKNGNIKEVTKAPSKRLSPLEGTITNERESIAPFSLSSHFATQRSDNKLPPLKRRPLGDMPPLSPSKTTPVKSKQESEENEHFEKDIANLLNMDDDFEPVPETKNGAEAFLFDQSLDSKDKSATVGSDDDDEDNDPFWKVLNSKVRSPLHKFDPPTSSERNIELNTEKPKEDLDMGSVDIKSAKPKEVGGMGLASLGLRELPPLQRTPLSSITPQQPVAVTTEKDIAANEPADYSEDFDSDSHELLHRGERKDDLLDDFAVDQSLSFAVEELDEDEDSLGIDLGDDDNQLLSGSFSGEDFRNIVTPSSLSAPIAADDHVPQSSKLITGAQTSNEDLNMASDEYVSKRKEEMEVMFLENQVKPGDEDYVYDKEVDFDQEPKVDSCGWDTDSEISDF